MKITEIFAFISKDKNGHEGIMAAMTNNGTMLPLIGADVERVDCLRPVADNIKKQTGMEYEIRYFISSRL